MVDLHCHILPGLDDGAATMEDALELARSAEAAGIETIAATPHIRDDHPFSLDVLPERLEALRTALSEAGIAIDVVAGGEVALSKLTELTDDELAQVSLGEGPYVLVESPYTPAPALLESALFDLQLQGFKPVLAHPERSISFLNDRARLERLVDGGVLCSVTAMSVAGGFGTTVRRFTTRLFSTGLVHNIASDAHDPARRSPDLKPALAALDADLDADGQSLAWFTDDAARAIVEGHDLPEGAPNLRSRPSGWRRMKERVGLA